MSDPITVRTYEDLSQGDIPELDESKRANALLDDAANRRKYRGGAFGLSVLVVLFLGFIIYKLMCAVTSDIHFFSPWTVGIFATLVVAVTVVTLSLLRATFSAPDRAERDKGGPEMPQMTLLSEVLKTMATAVEALTKVVSK